MTARRATSVVGSALRRGAPTRRDVIRAISVGALAQLCGVALVGGATGLLAWSATRPGLAAVAGLLIAVELVAFLRAPLRHAERVDAHDLGLDGLSGWRTWLLDGVATWTPSRLGAARAGDLLARCLEDADRLQDLWVRILVPAVSSLAALVLAGCLLAFAVPAAGLAVLLATVVVVTSSWASSSHVAQLGVDEATIRGSIASRVVEFTHGAAALELLGADAMHVATTASLVHRADELAARRAAIISALGVLASACTAISFFAAVAAVPLPSTHPWLGCGVVLAVLACGELLASLPASLESLGPVAGAAVRVGDLADPVVSGTEPAVRGPLVLDRVDVAAAADEPVIIAAVDIVAASGAPVAVGGPSGSGKSALLATAACLEPCRSGRVTLGDVDVDKLEEGSLRGRVAWLPTEPGLLAGRVRDVLDLGRGLPDDVLAAALDTVGMAAPLADRGGLEAVVGERGHDLSSGERRRLALARLLAGRPDVYVLDEPTAGLDDASAAAVMAALDATGAAVLVASHDDRVAAWATTSMTIVGERLSR